MTNELNEPQHKSVTPMSTVLINSLISLALKQAGLASNETWSQRAEYLERVVLSCHHSVGRPLPSNWERVDTAMVEYFYNHPRLPDSVREALTDWMEDVPGLSKVLNQTIDCGAALSDRTRVDMYLSSISMHLSPTDISNAGH